MGLPDFSKTQRALHLELVKVAKECAEVSGGPAVSAEQSPLSAALDYIDAFDVKNAVKPEPGGGIRNVDALKDKGLALAYALLGVSAELQDGTHSPSPLYGSFDVNGTRDSQRHDAA